jgi:hypothetical protein
MTFLNSRNPTSLLALALEGHRVEGVVLRRTRTGAQVQRAFAATLDLDPLTNDPELVGRELRNRLDETGVRERRCAVSLPLDWALTLQVKLPPLPEAEVQGFLNVQAERGFPYAPEDLAICSSRYSLAQGEQQATLVAIPKNHLVLLERVLRAAQLKPTTFSLGITALQEATSPAALVLAVGQATVGLQVCHDGGVAALRALQGAVETNGPQRRADSDLLGREIRITLGQLPAEVRERMGRLRVFGEADVTEALLPELEDSLKPIGLTVERGSLPQVAGLGALSADQAASPLAVALATRGLAGKASVFEFLPPKVSPWTQVTSRFSSARVLWTSATASGVALLIGGAFLWQYAQLASLQARWRLVGPRVREIEGLQQQIRRFRPWFDESPRSLAMLRRVTEAFPEDGAVSAKTLEVRDLTTVSCTGVAQDNRALLRVLDRLREAPHIEEVKLVQVRGKAPLQFSISFRWAEGGGL